MKKNGEALSELSERVEAKPIAVVGLPSGNTNIDAYIVGVTDGGGLAGLSTKLVET